MANVIQLQAIANPTVAALAYDGLCIFEFGVAVRHHFRAILSTTPVAHREAFERPSRDTISSPAERQGA